MHWLLWVLISAVCFASATLLQRVLMKDGDSDPVAYAGVQQILVAVILFVVTLLTGTGVVIPGNFSEWGGYLVLSVGLYATGNWLFYKAFQQADASEVGLIGASRSMWTVLSAGVLLGEAVGALRLLGTVVVVLGVVMVSWKKGRWQFSNAHLWALLAAILTGLAFTNDGILLGYFDISSYLVLAFLLPGVAVFGFEPKAVKKVRQVLEPKVFKKILATSLLISGAASTIWLAYEAGGDASQISPISQISVVIMVIAGYLFLGEKDNLRNKLFGSGLVLAGAWLLA